MKQFLVGLCVSIFALNVWATNSLSLNQLKSEIINLAKANTTSTTKRVEVRKKLNELTNQLTKDLPKVSEKQWVLFAPGPWKQIWSDERNNGTQEIEQNLDRIYQYVTPQGQAINLGERILPDGSVVTFALRAQGTVNGPLQTTEIVAGFFMPTAMPMGASIEELSLDILDSTFLLFSPVELGEFPRGPIGAKSDLNILFLDDDLKVGTAPNVYTGESEMFVLERAENIR